MLSVVAHKTVISVGLRGSAFKFVALDQILEAEAGVTTNEPEQIAVQQAIEKAVHAMIVEGAGRNLWTFADKAYQGQAISKLSAEQGLTPDASKLAGSPAAPDQGKALAASGSASSSGAKREGWQPSVASAAEALRTPGEALPKPAAPSAKLAEAARP
jgi:curli production assembly/transport component CsgG